MNRIYVSISTEQLKSADRGRCYLAYLLIRKASKKQAGGFSLDLFLNTVGLKHRAGSNLLKQLVERRLVIQETKTNFRIVAQRRLISECGKQIAHQISDKDLSGFSLKKIADFRAFLSELEAERYTKVISSVAGGYSAYSHKDKFKEPVRNQQLEKYDQLMALACVCKLIGVSMSTAHNYRRKQQVSDYSWKKVIEKKPRRVVSDKISWRPIECETGKSFYKGDLIVHFPIAKRRIKDTLISWRH